MKRTMSSTIALTVCLLGVAQWASAGVRDPHVNHDQHRQDARIVQGVRSGELTRKESKDLVQDQRQIRQEERQFKSDGQLTKNERQELHQDQAAASKEIYQEKHDAQDRPKAQ